MSAHIGNSEPLTAPAPLIRPFMPELDTLRGIAVLGVVLLHGFFWQYSGLSFGRPARVLLSLTQPGWVGVNLFFVLSGFLISGILLDSKDRPNFYRRFYTRRALRILPPYYGLLVLLLLLRTASPAFVALSFVYLANMTALFGVACDYGPLWSLAVEEQYYILWPMVVRRLTMRQLAWISAFIVVFIPILRAISFSLHWKMGTDWYIWFTADGLAAGCLLAIVLRTKIHREHVRHVCYLLLTVPLIAGAAGLPFGISTRNQVLGAGLQETVINTFFAGVLLVFLLAGSGAAKRYVNIPVFRFLGYISYGLYLDHLLVFRMYDRICRNYFPRLLPSSNHFELVLLRFAVGAGAAVGAAYLSRRFFEERFLRLKDSLMPGASAENEVLMVPSPPEPVI